MGSSAAAQADGPLREAAADAATFFAEMVLPSIAEFLKDRADKRRGCIACLVLASMSDHYFHTPGAAVAPHRDADSYRRSHAAVNWSVGTIIGIANATKHVLRKPGRVGFGDVFADDIDCGNLRCGWPINGREVMVEVAPDNLWLLSDLVEEAARYWAEKVAALPNQP
jgi:hypothetical protein